MSQADQTTRQSSSIRPKFSADASDALTRRTPDDHHVVPPASQRFARIALLLLCLAQWLAYRNSFTILPASDDFPIVNEIHRGDQLGISAFFTDSVIRIGYRPLKSLAIWAGGHLSAARPMVGVRILNLLALSSCGIVVYLWSRSMRLGRAGTIGAIAMVLLHPIMAAATGSCDGIDAIASSALLWFGAWCIFAYRDRALAATLSSTLCFIVGLGFKENLFALVPLSALTIVCFWQTSHRLRGLLAVCGTLLLITIGMLVIRQHVIRGGMSEGAGMFVLSPRTYFENITNFTAGLLLFGDSIWVFLHRTPTVLAIVGASMLAVLLLIGVGIWSRIKASRDHAAVHSVKLEISAARWITFLSIGLCISSCPALLLFHVSEMYVPPMVLPFALLVGFAADGWACLPEAWHRLSRSTLRAMAAVSVVAIILASAFSLQAIDRKLAGLRDVGDRAADQIAQILSFLPPDAHDVKVAILFDVHQLPARRTYSVFRMGDEILLVHRDVLDWPRPGKHLELFSSELERIEEFDPAITDIALKWDVPSQKFFRFTK